MNTTPSDDERINFWGISYARRSLIETCEILDELRAGGHRAVTREALVMAVAVSYCRMFTTAKAKNGKTWRLDKSYVDPVHLPIHEDLLAVRHKVYGHKDMSEMDDHGNLLNRVIVRIGGPTDVVVHTIIPLGELPDMVNRTEAVCRQVMSKAQGEIIVFMLKYGFATLPPGGYELSLEANADPWLKLLPQ